MKKKILKKKNKKHSTETKKIINYARNVYMYCDIVRRNKNNLCFDFVSNPFNNISYKYSLILYTVGTTKRNGPQWCYYLYFFFFVCFFVFCFFGIFCFYETVPVPSTYAFYINFLIFAHYFYIVVF